LLDTTIRFQSDESDEQVSVNLYGTREVSQTTTNTTETDIPGYVIPIEPNNSCTLKRVTSKEETNASGSVVYDLDKANAGTTFGIYLKDRGPRHGRKYYNSLYCHRIPAPDMQINFEESIKKI